MTQRIYHLNEQGQLDPMMEEQFALEDKLQELVANHPGLLSGEQMNPDNPRRFILTGREQGIADIVGGCHRWSLDHLLIDQDAIPTLVEAKRSANSEIRRSIIGQIEKSPRDRPGALIIAVFLVGRLNPQRPTPRPAPRSSGPWGASRRSGVFWEPPTRRPPRVPVRP